jgi:hypothetical protein
MKKTRSNKTSKAPERKIDMAEHGYRVKTLGLSERVVKRAIRILILLVVPVVLVILWFIKAAK